MTFYINVNLINKIIIIFSFNLTDIQSASDNSFISILLNYIDILNMQALSAINKVKL